MNTPIINTLIQPPESLLTPVTNPDTGNSGYAFPLQTAAWLNLQRMVTTALKNFPVSNTDFQDLYGTFGDEGTVEQAVSILSEIHDTLKKYGDPDTLIKSLPQFQQSDTAPREIYGHAVWLAAQTQLAAQQIRSLLNQGLADIGKIPPATRIAELTELLTGEGGINSYATTLQDYISNFELAAQGFYDVLNPELTGQSNSLSWYLSLSDNILAEAETIAGADHELIDGLVGNIKTLTEEYVDFTLAAELAPVFLLFPVFGVVLAIADGVTFAEMANKVKGQLDGAFKDLKLDTDDEQKKTALVAALKQFKVDAENVEADGQEFLDAISGLMGGWSEFSSQIVLRLRALTPADVAHWGEFLTQLGFENAIEGWDLIAAKAESFYQNGFVRFSTPKPN